MPSFAILADGIAGAVAIFFSILLTPLLRSWRTRWGATDLEIAKSYPGDEIIPNPRLGWTYAVTIRTTPDRVWPWIVQIGCRRAGWYSYDLLDNGGQPSAVRILSEHQKLAVGDTIPMEPKGAYIIPVALIETGHVMVLGGNLPTAPDDPISTTWTFVVESQGENTARLISRWRVNWKPGFLKDLGLGVFTEAIGFVMDRKMLMEIKRRAEA